MLRSVLETAISPELIPGARERGEGNPDGPERERHADSESVVGPFELSDFFLYYIAPLRLSPEQSRLPRAPRLERSQRVAGGPI